MTHRILSRSGARVLLFLVLLASNLQAGAQPNDAFTGSLCIECISIRVGLPRVVRGPSLTIADNHFTEIVLPNGLFRGFDAHAETSAIDGKMPWDMSAPGQVVLRPGKAGSYDSCGQWLNHAETAGAYTIGFVHAETACDYARNNQTHKSMAVATSPDGGLTWKDLGQILTSSQAPAVGQETGEGDCTVVNGKDGNFYAYCVRASDRALIVARAPTDNFGPNAWHKYFNGAWLEPGLGGNATRVGNGSGASVARWELSPNAPLVMTGWVTGGLGIFLSSDRTTLTKLGEPLLPFDTKEFIDSTPDRLLYPVLLDAQSGTNQLSNSWYLVYAYWPANQARDQKYLVFREITVSTSRNTATPQVGVLLARWRNVKRDERWTTTAPVPGNYASFQLDAKNGYVMTTAPPEPSAQLEECVKAGSLGTDFMLAEEGFCAAHGYRHLRMAGWVYVNKEPYTLTLYRCYNAKTQSHFASNDANCENVGKEEKLLGYVLAQ